MKTPDRNQQLMNALKKIGIAFRGPCKVLVIVDKGKVVIDRAMAVYDLEDEEAEDVPAEDAKIIHEDKPEWRRGFL